MNHRDSGGDDGWKRDPIWNFIFWIFLLGITVIAYLLIENRAVLFYN